MDIQELIHDSSKLGADTLLELKEIVDKYPFYQTARLLYIANLYKLHDASFGKELRKASVMVPDCTALFTMTEGTNYILETGEGSSSDIETEIEGSRTISLIDSFLNKQTSEGEEGKNQPSIADLTTDYASFLIQHDDVKPTEQAGEAPKLRGADLIDSFIEETKGKQRFEMPELKDDYFAAQSETANEEFTSPTLSDEDEVIYTESMVNIYIKQQRYEQALEILRKICLNNPKKSSNFAAQIQLLEVITSKKQ